MLPTPEKIQIILPIASFICLALGFYKNIYGVVGYFIIMASRMGLLFPELGAIRIELVAAVIVFISMFLKGDAIARIVHQKEYIHNCIILLTLIGLLSMLQAVNIQKSWEFGYLEYLKVFLFYLMLIGSIRTAHDLKIIIWAFVLITVWIAYEPVANYFSGVFIDYDYGPVALGRVGFAAGHVALANTLCQALPIAYFGIKYQSGKVSKTVLISALIFIVVGVVLSKSRGGFIGLVAVALGVIYFSKEKLKTTLLIALIFALSVPLFGEDYLQRISTITHGIHGGRSSSDRYIGLVNGFEMFMKRPLLGVGIGCYAEARRLYFNYYFYAHNLYGELLGELGLASLAWFAWIYLTLKKSQLMKKMLDPLDDKGKFYHDILCGIQLSIALRLVLGNFTHGWYIWFWFMMAALVVGIENILVAQNNKQVEVQQ